MNDYKEKILKELVEKYRNSKKDRGENKINRATKIVPQKLYKKYNANDGDIDEIERLNQAIKECSELHFVTYEKIRYGYEIKEIILVDEAVSTIEAYLKQHYHFISKQEKLDDINQLLGEYDGGSLIINEICQEIHVQVEQNKIPKRYKELENLFKALIFIENNKEDLFIREASMLIYGSSKYLEEVMLHEICKTIREHRNIPCSDNEMEDEILNEYHIKRESQRICVKGNCIIETSKGTIDVSIFNNGIEFSSNELTNIHKIILKSNRFLTIENKTAYHRYHASDTVSFYLGGYMTRFQRDFICLINEFNLDVQYEHFGDIDAGGFFIFGQLCNMTQIQFKPYCMNIEQMCDERFKSCLQKLTDTDIVKLKNLQNKGLFQEEIAYMLDHQVKLEQEIICYYLMLK